MLKTHYRNGSQSFLSSAFEMKLTNGKYLYEKTVHESISFSLILLGNKVFWKINVQPLQMKVLDEAQCNMSVKLYSRSDTERALERYGPWASSRSFSLQFAVDSKLYLHIYMYVTEHKFGSIRPESQRWKFWICTQESSYKNLESKLFL